jgi:hypothetical protein
VDRRLRAGLAEAQRVSKRQVQPVDPVERVKPVDPGEPVKPVDPGEPMKPEA